MSLHSHEHFNKSRDSLYEIRMLNKRFDQMTLRGFPFTGDIIFVRIFRGKDSIIPHGETEIHLKDRLIVTGTKEYADVLKRELEFCETHGKNLS